LKVLSIKQPWAWLIAKGFKDIDNRNWATKFRGRVYIHAGLSESEMRINVIRWIGDRLSIFQAAEFTETLVIPGLFFGGIIGEVDIVGCVTELKSPWFEGKYGFVLANPKAYEVPIPCKGKLGFFTPDIPQEASNLPGKYCGSVK
jgi:hypothetical protein